jgi:hypothetical protein
MKTALLVGCGSKWGAEFTKHLSDRGYQIDLLSGSDFSYPNVTAIRINWFELTVDKIKELVPKKNYDLIFFNQNSGGSPNDHYLKPGNELDVGQWNYHNWINVQLPYYLVKHLATTTTKVGWMLTGLIAGHDANMFQYAGYATVKSANLHIMRGFSQFHPGVFFAINPLWFPLEDYAKDAEQITSVIESLKLTDSGKTFNKNGSEWLL